MDTSSPRARRAGHPLIALVAALLCGLALAACGSDSDSGGGGSDEDQVREVAEQLSSNDPAACSKLTEDFLKQLGTKEECEKSAEEDDDDGPDPTVEDVKVDGDTATAVVVDEDRSTLKFVKQDDEWLVDGVEVERGAGKSDTTEEETTPEETETAASPDQIEIDARAAADALLLGVRDADEAVVCGLLDESYAQKLTGASAGVAACVEALKTQNFNEVQKALKGVESDEVTVSNGGKIATVKLTNNGGTIALERDGGRYVITGGL